MKAKKSTRKRAERPKTSRSTSRTYRAPDRVHAAIASLTACVRELESDQDDLAQEIADAAASERERWDALWTGHENILRNLSERVAALETRVTTQGRDIADNVAAIAHVGAPVAPEHEP